MDIDEEIVSDDDSGPDIILDGVPNLQKVLDTEVKKISLIYNIRKVNYFLNVFNDLILCSNMI